MNGNVIYNLVIILINVMLLCLLFWRGGKNGFHTNTYVTIGCSSLAFFLGLASIIRMI
jgi:hypothetical protein